MYQRTCSERKAKQSTADLRLATIAACFERLEVTYALIYLFHSSRVFAATGTAKWKQTKALIRSAKLLPEGRFAAVVDDVRIFHRPRRFFVEAFAKGAGSVLHNNCILASRKMARSVAKGIRFVEDEVAGVWGAVAGDVGGEE